MVAKWSKSLESRKDGELDVFILKGNASFDDPQSVPPRALRGDTIFVWLDPSQPTPKSAKSAAPDASSTDDHGRRLSKIEVIGNVFCQAPEIKIWNTNHLVATFKDPDRGGSGSGSSRPPSSGVPGPKGSAPAVGSDVARGSGSSSTATQPEPAKPKQQVMELTAHDVSASFLRFENRNDLLTLTTQGDVHVHQEPATKYDKGIDIT